MSVGHEMWGLNGIVSWLNTADIWKKTSRQIQRCMEETQVPCDNSSVVIHQVRDPMLTISSMLTMVDISWRYMEKYLEEDLCKYSPLIRSAVAWMRWNDLAKSKSLFTYRVEDISSVWSRILYESECTRMPFPDSISKGIHSRNHKNFGWEDLKKEDKNIFLEVKDRAISYGY
jgi:hypothetical protein